MAELQVDWRAWRLDKLTPRALSLFEYFYGLYLARAFAERGVIIKKATQPLVGTLWEVARDADSKFDSLGDGAGRFDLTLNAPDGRTWHDQLTFPAGWKKSHSNSVERALGQMFLKQLQAYRSGGKKSGTTRKEDSIANQIEREVSRLRRAGTPQEQWRGTIANKVGCSRQYVGRVICRLKLN